MPGIGLGHDSPLLVWCVLLLISVWSLFWKGLALWHAAQERNKKWFVVILLLNSVGILEIIYLFVVLKRTRS